MPSEQTQRLRKINFFGEILDSHVLHAYMLAAPDFLGAGSVFPLARTHPDVVLRALRLKKLAGDLCAAIGGRHTHPITLAVGGFTHLPQARDLAALRARLEAARADVEATVALFQSLPLPAFERETEYVALHRPDEYAFMGGEIASATAGAWRWTLPRADQRDSSRRILPLNTPATSAARTWWGAGALQHQPRSTAPARPGGGSRARPPARLHQSILITVAQVVEIVHCVETPSNTWTNCSRGAYARERRPSPTR